MSDHDSWQQEGGPAFPIILEDGASYKGMSLRDHFAGLAMQAGCAVVEAFPATREEIAAASYAMADVMLAERDK